MRIFFTTPFSGRQRFQRFIDEILLCLKEQDATIISPERHELYAKSIQDYEARGLSSSEAHYTFIANAITEADVVIIEASQESLRVGHEITLALMYGKPTLVLSQTKNYAEHISNELLTGAKYQTKQDIRFHIKDFLSRLSLPASEDYDQDIRTRGQGVDSLKLTTFTTMRQHALQDTTDFGILALLAEDNQDEACKQVMQRFGGLPIERPWAVRAAIQAETAPDFVFAGLIRFLLQEFSKLSIQRTDHIVDVLTHSGSIAQLLSQKGFSQLTAVHSSRKILAKTYEACADNYAVTIAEDTVATLSLQPFAKAVIWANCTSNLVRTKKDLHYRLQTLADNVLPGGCLIFDVRTVRGWQAYLFEEKIATFATTSFQQILLTRRSDRTRLVHQEHFIRLKYANTLWGPWRREESVSRMWSLNEVKAVATQLKDCRVEGIYDETFTPLKEGDDPAIAYFVLVKRPPALSIG